MNVHFEGILLCRHPKSRPTKPLEGQVLHEVSLHQSGHQNHQVLTVEEFQRVQSYRFHCEYSDRVSRVCLSIFVIPQPFFWSVLSREYVLLQRFVPVLPPLNGQFDAWTDAPL